MKYTTILVNQLRRLLPYKLKQAGKKALGMPTSTLHQDWSILSQVGPVEGAHIVFDLGARNGWFFDNWVKWCPHAIVHAFEPDTDAFDRLQAQYDSNKNIHINKSGVGATKSVETFYHFTDSEVSSSFLQPNQDVWKEIHYETGELSERQVEVITLDDYCAEHNIDDIYLIKIDIQGYELQALKGALNTLRNTSYLLIESSIKPLYKNTASFTQVHEFMSLQGFHMVDLRAWHRGNNVLMEADMLFRRNDLAPTVNPDRENDRDYI